MSIVFSVISSADSTSEPNVSKLCEATTFGTLEKISFRLMLFLR